jgi:hypothetical protein
MATILWNIWKQRNNKVWNNTLDGHNFVIVCAEEMVKDWIVPRLSYSACYCYKWVEKPLHGRMKCNIDAIFVGSKVEIGMCIRDDCGHSSLLKRNDFRLNV